MSAARHKNDKNEKAQSKSKAGKAAEKSDGGGDPSVLAHRSATARRLGVLLKYLRMDDNLSEFARKVHISRAQVSRMARGHRGDGKKGMHTSALLKLNAKRYLGLSPRYWESEKELDPSECMGPLGDPAVDAGPATMAAAAVRDGDVAMRIAKFAAERGADGNVVRDLMLTKAPENADVIWWLSRYLELSQPAKRK